MLPELFNIDTALITTRTVVRRFRETEGKSFFQLLHANEAAIRDLFPDLLKVADTQENAEWYIRQELASWLLQQSFSFGIWDKESALMIGFIQVIHLDWALPQGELRFFMDKDKSGKGLMTEVMAMLVAFCFHQLKLEKIGLRTPNDNFTTQRLARKCGFSREGDLRSSLRRSSGELTDLMLMGLTKSEYEKV